MAKKTNDEFTVGWVCAVSVEYIAALEFLDEEYGRPQEVARHDNNDYTIGKIDDHNVVIAVLPEGEYGTVSAASVARDMLHSFPNIRIGLMVGIGGGAPSADHDIRLGDVVVSIPWDGKSGVFQYDFGKTIQEQGFQSTRFLDQPPTILRTAVSGLRTQYKRHGHHIGHAIDNIIQNKNPRLRKEYGRPAREEDRLYRSDFVHPRSDRRRCADCCGNTSTDLVARDERTEGEEDPVIHYGLIASGNQLMQDAMIRDRLAAEQEVLCFEMEAAGLMNHFPCLIVRGICDYSDSHKNREWQGYAAMTAAAYAKDLLRRIAPNSVENERRISELISDVVSTVNVTQMKVTEMGQHVEQLSSNKHQDAIYEWLSPPDPSTNYNSAMDERLPGSGTWLLQDPRYTRWKEKPSSFLWLNGIPGCGKSILSSTVIEDLRNDTATKAVVYFYFSFTDMNKQALDHAIRTLISQLYYASQPNGKEHLDTCFVQHDSGRREPSTGTLCGTFQQMVQQVGDLWIVLDALDECPRAGRKRESLMDWIQSLCAEGNSTHLLVTSRPEQDIGAAIGQWALAEDNIPLQSDLVSGDIASYICWAMENRREVKRWRTYEDVRQEIEKTLVEKANGMFRWVSCQFDTLDICLSPCAVSDALKSLPKTLDDTYTRILDRLQNDYPYESRRLLQFLAFSERPLRIKEAVETLTIDTTAKPRFNIRRRVADPEEVSRYCGSLARIVRRQDAEDANISELQLAHFSVQEYLMSNRVEYALVKDIQLKGRATIAETCLAYLLELGDEPIHQLQDLYPLALFAAEFWSGHAAAFSKEQENAHNLAMMLFTTPHSYRICLNLFNPDLDGWVEGIKKRKPTPLYYASLTGLYSCVEEILNRGSDVNAQGGIFGTALQAASVRGSLDIVRLLLDKGADIKAQVGAFGNALQTASALGRLDLVRLLFDKGADINARDGVLGTALHVASCQGRLSVVRFLLDNGADVNARGGQHQNALGEASARGHLNIVRLLLDKGGKVNGSALAKASSGGHVDIVQLLLDEGAEVNAQDETYGTALHAASIRGDPYQVRSFLDAGGKDSSTSQFVATEGEKATVQLLLDSGAEVDARDKDDRAPLIWATWGGHEAAVQLLLDKGAKVELEDNAGLTAFKVAAHRCYGVLERMLVLRGASDEDSYGLKVLFSENN